MHPLLQTPAAESAMSPGAGKSQTARGFLGFQERLKAVLLNITQQEGIRTSKWALGKTSSYKAKQSTVRHQQRWHSEPSMLFNTQECLRVKCVLPLGKRLGPEEDVSFGIFTKTRDKLAEI